MKNRWNYISNLGLTSRLTTAESRSITLSNQLAVIITGLAAILILGIWLRFGLTRTTPILLFTLGLFITIPWLNSRHQHSLARILLCYSIPLLVLSQSLVAKLGDDTEVFEYFDARIIILVSTVIPAIIFSSEEKKKVFFSLSTILLVLLLFDPIHNWLDLGFYQKGFTSDNYSFINIVFLISFGFLVGSVMFLKNTIVQYESEKERFIKQLNEQNNELRKQFDAIHEQRQELLIANNMIEQQTQELSEKNKKLELLVTEKAQDLIDTNNELVQHNNELRQFSYTISHNLRAPVASLIGLTNIFKEDNLNQENTIILNHMKKSAESLDKVFSDLNKVLELRNNVSSIKEKVILSNELAEIKQTLENEIEASGIRIIEDFQIDTIYTIRPFINSILYNLVSNAIKYRASRRNSFIRIKSVLADGMVVIRVEDNGLGMDIEQHRSNLFKMYKRFHEHTEGKGLGLYLVKLQTESLGGNVTVDSKVNEGTTFTLSIKYFEDIHNQTILENEYCRISYDAFSNITGVSWKREVNSDEFRDTQIEALELFRQYHTPNYLSDLRTQVIPSDEDLNWMEESIFPEAIDYGLKKIALLTNLQDSEDSLDQYINRISSISANLGNTFATFHSVDEAKEWLAD